MHMWFLPIPPTVNIFSWQLIMKRIRTRDQVFTNEHIDRSCPFYHSDMESIDHLFIYCSFSKQVWEHFSLSINPLFWNASFIDWLDSFRVTRNYDSNNILPKVLILYYYIWHVRNKFIFKNLIMSPIKVFHTATTTTLQFWNANPTKCTQKQNSNKLIRWHPLDNDFVKLNFVHVWREDNFVTNVIAKAGHLIHILVWEHSLPMCVANVFYFDQLSCGCFKKISL